MAGQRPLRYPKPRYDHHYLVPQQRIPGYLPYPNPVAPGNIPVPNASSVDWPQAQFAPPWLPAGSASFSPYVYPNYSADTPVEGGYFEMDGDLGEAMGAEWAEDWRPVGTFIAGLAVGYLLFSPNSPMKG